MRRFIMFLVVLLGFSVVVSGCGGGGGGGGTTGGGGTITAITLPDTGQTLCYDASGNTTACTNTPGQDGAFSLHPMSYTDNLNGTIKDNVTGLTWQKCSMGQTYSASANSCSAASTAATYNWYQANGTYDATNNPSSTNVCGSLNLNGASWRLPTYLELVTIVHYEANPTIDSNVFRDTAYGTYWSSSSYVPKANSAWVVNFSSGNTYSDEAVNDRVYVRCVR